MRLTSPILLIALLISVAPVLAAETIGKDNFAEPVIEPKLKEYYLPGDVVSFNLTIEPKTDDDAELIDGRIYEFNTSLENPTISMTVEYKDGGGITRQGKDYVKVEVNDWDYGLSRIKVEVSGNAPRVNSRIQNVVALYVDIQDAESDAISPVVVKVVNKKLFSSYIQQLERNCSELYSKASSLEERGALVGEIKSKLDSAKAKIDAGREQFNSGKYVEANSTLAEAESILNEARDMLARAEVELLKDEVDQKLEVIHEKITEFEIVVKKLESEGEPTLDYEVKLKEFKDVYLEMKGKVSQAENYIANGLYGNAEKILKEVNAKADEEVGEVDSILTQLSLEEKSESGVWESITERFSVIAGWFGENKGRVLLYGGCAVALAVVGFAGYKGFKRYIKRRKWDELK